MKPSSGVPGVHSSGDGYLRQCPEVIRIAKEVRLPYGQLRCERADLARRRLTSKRQPWPWFRTLISPGAG